MPDAVSSELLLSPSISRRIRRAWPFVALVMLAASTAVVLAHPGPLPGEVPYIRWLQRLGEPVPSVAEFVRATTGTGASIIVGIVPAVLTVRRFGRTGARIVLIALFATLVLQPVFKEVVDRPRPNASQVEVRAIHTSKSFPSGHSLGTTVVWGTIAALSWRHHRRALAAAAAIPIVLTGFASGVQGVHWPSDAIAGTLTGLLTVAVILAIFDHDGRPRPGTVASC